MGGWVAGKGRGVEHRARQAAGQGGMSRHQPGWRAGCWGALRHWTHSHLIPICLPVAWPAGWPAGLAPPAGFTPEERASFAANLVGQGMVDCFRAQYPQHVAYTYWGYR